MQKSGKIVNFADMAEVKTGYKSKSLDLSFKVEKNESGRIVVKGYFSGWGVIDSDADLLMPGSFSKSIQDRGPGSSANRKIAHLAFHDQTRPVGVIKVLKEDEKGLYFESELGTHTDGVDAAKMYEEGTIREHSIGFRYIPEKMEYVEIDSEEKIDALEASGLKVNRDAVKMYGGYYKITEVKLYEGSFVTFGANPETPNLSGKSEEEVNRFRSDLDHKVRELMKNINDGEKGLQIERQILYICKQYEALGASEPHIKHSVRQAAEEQSAESDTEEKSTFFMIAAKKR